MTKIEFNTHIKAPIERCFDLSRSIDFHKVSISPVFKEESVAGCTTGLIGHNQRTLMQSKLWGFQFSTELKIVKFNPPYFLSYEIADSNFHSIIHDYYFYDIGDETAMVNHFYYKLKLGVLGEIANLLILEKYLTRIITQRNDLLRDYAETDKWQEILPAPKIELSIVC
jgi:ligand-binding SRPBCC domain-containing protein